MSLSKSFLVLVLVLVLHVKLTAHPSSSLFSHLSVSLVLNIAFVLMSVGKPISLVCSICFSQVLTFGVS